MSTHDSNASPETPRPAPSMTRSILQASVERNLNTFHQTVADLLAAAGLVEVHADPDAFWFLSDCPIPVVNSVSNLCFQWDEFAARVAVISTAAQARGVPQLWWVGPSSQPLDVGEQLLSMGMLPGEVIAGQVRVLDALPPPEPIPGLTVTLATTSAHVQDAATVIGAVAEHGGAALMQIVQALGTGALEADSALRLIVAHLDGQPVAAGWMAVGDGDAGLYHVVVHPAWQQRGIATALVATALHAAHDEGCALGILLAGKRYAAVAARLGFEECCALVQFLTPSSDS